MFLKGLGTALPDQRYTKADCWEAFASSDWFDRLDERSRAIARLVLHRDNGISARRLAVDSLAEVFTIDPDTLHKRFTSHAPKLATQAARTALKRAGIDAEGIDAVIVTTCTGYLCPGLTSYAIEQLGLRAGVLAFDLVGQGCAGALPNWQLASALLDSQQCDHILSICVEVSSAAMYLDNDPGVLISACLFGDGAGAAVLSRHPGSHREVRWDQTVSLTQPKNRDALRFEQRGGMLRNVLTRAVPALAAEYADQVLASALKRATVARDQISAWIMHAGGRDVLMALEAQMGLAPAALNYSRTILQDYGNLSSAFVYFVLEAALADEAPGGWWWMSSFGAGFSCHGALLKVE